MMKKIFSFLLFYGLISITGAQTLNSLPDSGNVGIGTDSPVHKLQVVGNTVLSGDLRVDSGLVVSDTLVAKRDVNVSGNLRVAGNVFLPNSTAKFTPMYLDPNVMANKLRFSSRIYLAK